MDNIKKFSWQTLKVFNFFSSQKNLVFNVFLMKDRCDFALISSSDAKKSRSSLDDSCKFRRIELLSSMIFLSYEGKNLQISFLNLFKVTKDFPLKIQLDISLEYL